MVTGSLGMSCVLHFVKSEQKPSYLLHLARCALTQIGYKFQIPLPMRMDSCPRDLTHFKLCRPLECYFQILIEPYE